MNQRVAKAIKKTCDIYQLPKRVYRRIKKTKLKYNLDLTNTLRFIDVVAEQYHKKGK